jgi:hypothetical protein
MKKKTKFGGMMSRDIIVAYVVFTVGILLNMGIYMTLPEAEYCRLYSKTQGTLEGNCTYLQSLMEPSIEYDRAYAEKYQQTLDEVIEKFRKERINITTTCDEPPECEKCNPNKPVQCAEPIPCVCDICHSCPQCPDIDPEIGLTPAQNKWLLNECQIRDGASCYQSGSADTCDKVREKLDIPGRPKFKSRPSPTGYASLKKREELICFRDLGDYFILNRTPDEYGRKRWGWNDQKCVSSVLRVNHL